MKSVKLNEKPGDQTLNCEAFGKVFALRLMLDFYVSDRCCHRCRTHAGRISVFVQVRYVE